MSGALAFGAATSDRVDCGSAADIDNLTTVALLLWVYPTTLTLGRQLIAKQSATGWNIRLNDATGNIRFFWFRTGTNLNFATNDTPLATLSVWYKVFVTCVPGTGTHIYSAPLNSALTERTYGTSAPGGAPTTADAAETLTLGNRTTGTPTEALQGRIGPCALFKIVPTLAQAEEWFRRPKNQIAGTAALRFWRLGKDGADAIEYTGAGNGTVTGATQSDGVPLHQGDCLWQRDPISGLHLMTA